MKYFFTASHPYLKTYPSLTVRRVPATIMLKPIDREQTIPAIKQLCSDMLVALGIEYKYSTAHSVPFTHPDKHIMQVLIGIYQLNFRRILDTDARHSIENIFADDTRTQALREKIYEILMICNTTMDKRSVDRVCHNTIKTICEQSMSVDDFEDDDTLRSFMVLFHRLHRELPTLWIVWFIHLILTYDIWKSKR